MKLLRKVPTIDIKRHYVASQYIRKHGVVNRYLPKLSREDFIKKLTAAKKYVNKLTPLGLDRIISKEWKKRLPVYNKGTWYLASASIDELGVWYGAGGLPKSWTTGSLKKTIVKVAAALKNNDRQISARAKRSIPRIIEHIEIIKTDPFLFPTVLSGGTMGRKKCQLMTGDIEDGCMRAIALGLTGTKILKIYFNKV